MEQSITKKPISPFKRMGIFVLDGIMALVIFFSIFYTGGVALTKHLNQDQITSLNQQYQELCDEYHYPETIQDRYGLIKVDLNYFMQNANGNTEKGFSDYQEAQNKISEKLNDNQVYQEAARAFNVTYILIIMIIMALSLFVFQFIIPLFSKKRQTLAMMIFKYSIVNKKDYLLISKLKVLLRFLNICVIEFVLVFLILNLMGIIFLILMSMCLIAISKSKATFHDLLTFTLVVPSDEAYSG